VQQGTAGDTGASGDARRGGSRVAKLRKAFHGGVEDRTLGFFAPLLLAPPPVGAALASESRRHRTRSTPEYKNSQACF
jgi:hypothetical protein